MGMGGQTQILNNKHDGNRKMPTRSSSVSYLNQTLLIWTFEERFTQLLFVVAVNGNGAPANRDEPLHHTPSKDILLPAHSAAFGSCFDINMVLDCSYCHFVLNIDFTFTLLLHAILCLFTSSLLCTVVLSINFAPTEEKKKKLAYHTHFDTRFYVEHFGQIWHTCAWVTKCGQQMATCPTKMSIVPAYEHSHDMLSISVKQSGALHILFSLFHWRAQTFMALSTSVNSYMKYAQTLLPIDSWCRYELDRQFESHIRRRQTIDTHSSIKIVCEWNKFTGSARCEAEQQTTCTTNEKIRKWIPSHDDLYAKQVGGMCISSIPKPHKHQTQSGEMTHGICEVSCRRFVCAILFWFCFCHCIRYSGRPLDLTPNPTPLPFPQFYRVVGQ